MQHPIKVLQFGEGNFLRAFVDYMIHSANSQGIFNGSVAVVKAIPQGNLESFHAQNNQYTLIMRGMSEGQIVNTRLRIDSIADAIGAYEDYECFMAYSALPSLQIIVSNTTEAGITLGREDQLSDCPPKEYPSKLTKFLYARFRHFQGDPTYGLYLLPCELIEQNGARLRECVLKTARMWQLPEAFMLWLEQACVFCDTLVDRIVTGYPKDEVQVLEKELGYSDKLLDVCEPFGLWVIEDKKDIRRVLPLDKAGLPVVFAPDVTPYRERKVRILNGAHTATVLAAHLAGKRIVRECMQDPVIREYMRSCLYEEVIPCLLLDKEDVNAFTEAVFERFANPFIDHALLSISLNSVSKWKARILGSFQDYYKKYESLPPRLTFSFAALLAFYMGSALNHTPEYPIADDQNVLDFFAELNLAVSEGKLNLHSYVAAVAGNVSFWGEDLTSYSRFSDAVTSYIEDILSNGAYVAMQHVTEDNK